MVSRTPTPAITHEQMLALGKFSRNGVARFPSPATRGTNVVAMRGLEAAGLVRLDELGVGAWHARLTRKGLKVRRDLGIHYPGKRVFRGRP